MANCDVCGVLLTRAVSPEYSADEIRELVSNGFGLSEPSIKELTEDGGVSREQSLAAWRWRVEESSAAWSLCPECAARAAEYRAAPAVARSRRWLVWLLLAVAAVAIAVTLVGRAPKTEARSLRDSLGGVSVTSVAFSPDGQVIATGRDDLRVKLWDVSTGQEVRTLRGHTSRITDVAFSPDGKLLASTSNERVMRLWNVETGQEIIVSPDGHAMGIASVDFSPDGRTMWPRGSPFAL